jgi:predicted DNA-binding protein (UPF0251 family)
MNIATQEELPPIKDILKYNDIDQKEFAEYLGISRVGLNKNLNHSKQKRGLINNLKFLIAEKRGFKIDVDLSIPNYSS